MNLADYLATTGTTQQDMAAAIHRSQSVVSRLAAGVQEPDPVTARRIVAFTKGKVRLCDLYLSPADAKRWCKCQ